MKFWATRMQSLDFWNWNYFTLCRLLWHPPPKQVSENPANHCVSGDTTRKTLMPCNQAAKNFPLLVLGSWNQDNWWFCIRVRDERSWRSNIWQTFALSRARSSWLLSLDSPHLAIVSHNCNSNISNTGQKVKNISNTFRGKRLKKGVQSSMDEGTFLQDRLSENKLVKKNDF